MTEILTESFCERCGTRYTFESARPRTRLKGVKVLSRGLKNFVMSDETSMDEAMAAARSETDRELTSHQLDAFHKTFNFCMSCRQYTCPNCWNEVEARCLSCAPHLGTEVLPAPFPDMPVTPAFLRNANGASGANGSNGTAHPAEMIGATEVETVRADDQVDAAARLAALTSDAVEPPPDVEADIPYQAGTAVEVPPAIEPVAEAAVDADIPYQVVPAIEPVAEAAVDADIPYQVVPEAEPEPEPAVDADIPYQVAPAVESVAEPAVDADIPYQVAPAVEPVAEPVVAAAALIGVEPEAAALPAVAAELDVAAVPEVAAEPEPEAEIPAAPAAAAGPETVTGPEAPAPDAGLAAAAVADGTGTPAAAPDAHDAGPIEIIAAAAVVEAITPDAPSSDLPVDEKAAAQTRSLFQRFRPGQSLDAELDAYERDHPAIATDAAAAAAAAASVPAVEPPIAPDTAAPAPVVNDVVPQPVWQMVAPDPTADAAPAQPSWVPATPAAAKGAPAPAEPQWPTQPQWPSSGPANGLPFLGRPAAPQGGLEALWAESSREVATTPATQGRTAGVVQPCVSCGLSLSATAKFCRRCGTPQVG